MITPSRLRNDLSAILALEAADPVDWEQVSALSLALSEALHGNANGICPDQIYHFIDDFDIRQRDPAYADMQRDRVRAFLAL
jgi:hypothetical protein